MVRGLIIGATGLVKNSIMRFLTHDPVGAYIFPKIASQKLNWRNIHFGTHTSRYNCVAHSIGEKQWLGPNSNELTDWLTFFKKKGYSRDTTLNTTRKFGEDRVVLYGSSPTSISHVAKVLNTGNLSSKLGLGCIVHHSLEQLTSEGTPQYSLSREWLPSSPNLRLEALKQANFFHHILEVSKK